jgi:hypothetical protein
VELEPGGDLAAPDQGFALTVHVRGPHGDVRHLLLARCGPHPVVLYPQPEVAAELRGLLREPAAAGASSVVP